MQMASTASAVARIDPTLAADIRRSRLPEVFTLNFPRVCDRSCGPKPKGKQAYMLLAFEDAVLPRFALL
jgi:hypothetical protein